MDRTVKSPAANMLQQNMQRYNIEGSDLEVLEETIGFGTRNPKNKPKNRKTKRKSKVISPQMKSKKKAIQKNRTVNGLSVSAKDFSQSMTRELDGSRLNNFSSSYVSRPASFHYFRDNNNSNQNTDIAYTKQYSTKEERWVKNDLKLELLKARALLTNEQRVNHKLHKQIYYLRTFSAQHADTNENLNRRVKTLERLLEAANSARRQKSKEIIDLSKRFINLRTYVKATEKKWITVCDKKRMLQNESKSLQQKHKILQANFQITETLCKNLVSKSNTDTIKISMLERKIVYIKELKERDDKITRHLADKIFELSKLRRFLILEQRDKWKAEKQLLAYQDEIFAECMECFTTFLTTSCEIVPLEHCTTVALFFPRMTYLDCLIAFYSRSLSTITGQRIFEDYGRFCGFVVNHYLHQQRLIRYYRNQPWYSRIFRN